MTVFDKFHHDLTELVKKYEIDLGLKIEEDLEYEIIKIFGTKITSLARAQNGLNDVTELAHATAEHHPYWNLLSNCSEIGHTVLDNWKKSLSSDSVADINGINFEFYGSQRDATLRNNKIDISQSTYTNEIETPDVATGNLTSNYNVIDNRWEQEIWVYIENTNLSIIQSSCVGLEHVSTLYVEKRPVIYDVDQQLLCDNETTLDLYSVFDTSTLQNLILGNTTDPTILPFQDTSNFTIEYTYIDNSGTIVNSATLPSTINLTNQKIDIKLTNTAGVSQPFESIGSINFKVFQTPTPFSGIKIEECDDDESGADDDGISVFDIDLEEFKNSLFIDPLNTTSSAIQDYDDFEFNFSLYDNNDVLVSGPTNTLDPKVSAKNGYYIISEISNPLSTALELSCESSVRVDFVVNPLPNFDIDNEIVVCLNPLPDNPLEIGTYNWNEGIDPTVYNYSWSRVDLSGTQDTDYNENTPTIKVDKGGVYTVIIDSRIVTFVPVICSYFKWIVRERVKTHHYFIINIKIR